MTDFDKKMLVTAVALVGGYLLYKKAAAAISAAIPPVVKEGAEATGILATQGAHLIANPFDAFGLEAANYVNGKPYWERAAPQDNPADVVSNAPGGINFNLF